LIPTLPLASIFAGDEALEQNVGFASSEVNERLRFVQKGSSALLAKSTRSN